MKTNGRLSENRPNPIRAASRAPYVVIGFTLFVLTVSAPSIAIGISGHVRDKQGAGIADATVCVVGSDICTKSDTDGSFNLDNIVGNREATRSAMSSTTWLTWGRRSVAVVGPAGAAKSITVVDVRGRIIRTHTGTAPRLEAALPVTAGAYCLMSAMGSRTNTSLISVSGGRIVGGVMTDQTSYDQPRTSTASAAGSRSISSPAVIILEANKSGRLPGGAAVAEVPASNVVITLLAQDSFAAEPAYLNPALPIAERVDDLVSRMTKEEKLSQMKDKSVSIPHLGIPAYQWWNEALHGVARNGAATSFPQGIGMASSWDPELLYRVASVISDEARAKHPHYQDSDKYEGITMWSPNINIFRDPRWGRGQETYGEDPLLTSRMGVAFIQGLQGNHPRYLKTVATPKHFAAHSGPEKGRKSWSANPSTFDLRMTYLAAFKACIQQGRAQSIMCSYNRVYEINSCKSSFLMQDILRDEWGFQGFVVSDCGAAVDLSAGCDLACMNTYTTVELDSVVDVAVKRLFTGRMLLGMFDPPEMLGYAQISPTIVERPSHKQLAIEMARESIVLLKNKNAILPLSKNIGTIAVIGPNAADDRLLLGNYYGNPTEITNPLEGIQAVVGGGSTVVYEKGCNLVDSLLPDFTAAVTAAQNADVAIVMLGLGSESAQTTLEGESLDKVNLQLPGYQEHLLKAVHATGTPTVLVLISGSQLAVTWAEDSAEAIVQAWYGGQAGGTALAEVLFGDHNPSGKLPVTFYTSISELPEFGNYSMAGRTYRYYTGVPLYPFGYGLSYTTFTYSNLQVSPSNPTTEDTVTITATVTNTGNVAGQEVAQLYMTDAEASVPVPLRELEGFTKVSLTPGRSADIAFKVAPYQLSLINTSEKQVVEPGRFDFTVGGCQPGTKVTSNILSGSFTMGGSQREF